MYVVKMAMCHLHNSGSHITDDEIKVAEDKFAESLQLAQMGMFNLLENEVRFFIPNFIFTDTFLFSV